MIGTRLVPHEIAARLSSQTDKEAVHSVLAFHLQSGRIGHTHSAAQIATVKE